MFRNGSHTELSELSLRSKAIIACLPLVCGGTMPFFGLVNLVWGSIYGFPGIWFHELRIPHPLWTDLVWILGWPAIVVYLTGRLADLSSHFGRTARTAMLIGYVVSLLILVPAVPTIVIDPGKPFAYEQLPLFLRLLEY